ncbi:ash family protein [Yersinia enterocolitica]|nr:ash family protein [Yersinia enterocolitica]
MFCTYKNSLPMSIFLRYIFAVPHKTGAGIETPYVNRAHNRVESGFFMCKAQSRLYKIMVGRAGPTSVGPVFLFSGSLNPVRLTTPRLRPQVGELHPNGIGASSWQKQNSTPHLKIQFTSAQKRVSAYIVVVKYLSGCRLSFYVANTANRPHYGYPVCLVISQTTLEKSVKNSEPKVCCARRSSPPEHLIQPQRSAALWGVCLPDFQEE